MNSSEGHPCPASSFLLFGKDSTDSTSEDQVGLQECLPAEGTSMAVKGQQVLVCPDLSCAAAVGGAAEEAQVGELRPNRAASNLLRPVAT